MILLVFAFSRFLIVVQALTGSPAGVGMSTDIIVLADEDQWGCRHYDVALLIDGGHLYFTPRACEPEEVAEFLDAQ